MKDDRKLSASARGMRSITNVTFGAGLLGSPVLQRAGNEAWTIHVYGAASRSARRIQGQIPIYQTFQITTVAGSLSSYSHISLNAATRKVLE